YKFWGTKKSDFRVSDLTLHQLYSYFRENQLTVDFPNVIFGNFNNESAESKKDKELREKQFKQSGVPLCELCNACHWR
ncbi:9500_t:CDS:2, partial [Cetraspora pellucida]